MSLAIHGKYYYVLESGRSGNLRLQILSHLKRQKSELEEVYSVDKCDVILVLCPITSRTGTDIDAALNKLNNLSASKPAILLVLHYTFDPEKVVPDSSTVVKRMDTLTVDCLFYDTGLLQCNLNDEAMNRIVTHFKHQQEGRGFKSWLDQLVFLCGVCLFSLWSCRFSPGALVSPTVQRHVVQKILNLIGTLRNWLTGLLSQPQRIPLRITSCLTNITNQRREPNQSTGEQSGWLTSVWEWTIILLLKILNLIGTLWNWLTSRISQNKKRHDSDEERRA